MLFFRWGTAAHGARIYCPRPEYSALWRRSVVQECREAEAKCQLHGGAPERNSTPGSRITTREPLSPSTGPSKRLSSLDIPPARRGPPAPVVARVIPDVSQRLFRA